jgi:hypothetical protein
MNASQQCSQAAIIVVTVVERNEAEVLVARAEVGKSARAG